MATVTYSTEVYVGQTLANSDAPLNMFRTLIQPENDTTLSRTSTHRTRVGVRGPTNTRLAGRRDLLFTGRYRR